MAKPLGTTRHHLRGELVDELARVSAGGFWEAGWDAVERITAARNAGGRLRVNAEVEAEMEVEAERSEEAERRKSESGRLCRQA